MEQDGLDRLTERQRELLELVADGATTSKALAAKTGMTTGSIDTVLQAASKILGARDRREAARRYHFLKENSQPPSQLRILPLPNQSDSVASGPTGAARNGLKVVADFFRTPPLGGEEHELRWDQITMQVLRVAVVGMVSVIALVLLVLGFFKTFG